MGQRCSFIFPRTSKIVIVLRTKKGYIYVCINLTQDLNQLNTINNPNMLNIKEDNEILNTTVACCKIKKIILDATL